MSSYDLTILSDSPIAYYRMNETSGTIAHDSSGNHYDATLSGGFALGSPGAISHDADTSITFTNASSTVTLPYTLNYTTFTTFSLEYWITTTQVAWLHIVVTYDGTTTTLSINGVLSSSVTVSPLEISSIFDFAGTYNAASIAKIALYKNAVLSAPRIQAHFLASFSTSTSIQNARLYKSQVVKCYSASGTFLDTIQDAPYLTGFTEAVNAAPTSLKISLPRAIDAYDGENMPNSRQTIVLGNVLKWYLYGTGLPASGLLRYQGIIDTIRPHLDENGGESVELTITPYGQILGDHGIIGPITYGTAGSPGTYVDTGTIFSQWFTTQVDSVTGHPYGYPFTLDPSNPATTGNLTQFAYQNQTLLSTLTTTLLLSPANYFYRMNMDNTVSFNQYPLSNANYTLKLGQHITSMEYAIDNVPRKNLIVVQGKGVRATAAGSSISTIGERLYIKSDSRITDVNTAQLLANGLLAFYDRSQVRTKVKIPDYRGDAMQGIGFDIEQFKVGQTLKILDTKAPPAIVSSTPSLWGSFTWGVGDWQASPNLPAIWGAFKWGQTTWGASFGGVFNQVVPIVAINYAYHSVELELGFRQPSMLRSLYDLEMRFQDATLVS